MQTSNSIKDLREFLQVKFWSAFIAISFTLIHFLITTTPTLHASSGKMQSLK